MHVFVHAPRLSFLGPQPSQAELAASKKQETTDATMVAA